MSPEATCEFGQKGIITSNGCKEPGVYKATEESMGLRGVLVVLDSRDCLWFSVGDGVDMEIVYFRACALWDTVNSGVSNEVVGMTLRHLSFLTHPRR